MTNSISVLFTRKKLIHTFEVLLNFHSSDCFYSQLSIPSSLRSKTLFIPRDSIKTHQCSHIKASFFSCCFCMRHRHYHHSLFPSKVCLSSQHEMYFGTNLGNSLILGHLVPLLDIHSYIIIYNPCDMLLLCCSWLVLLFVCSKCLLSFFLFVSIFCFSADFALPFFCFCLFVSVHHFLFGLLLTFDLVGSFQITALFPFLHFPASSTLSFNFT